MLTLSPAVRIYLATGTTDLRRSIDGLHLDGPARRLARPGERASRLWAYLDPVGQQVVFDAAPTHERDGPAAFLATFAGKLQADAYAGYDGLYASGRMLEIGCMAYARRRFVDAFMTDPRAALLVALIQQLYHVERASADLDVEGRKARRQDESVPLLAKIDAVGTNSRARCSRSRPSETPCGIWTINGRRYNAMWTMAG
jgi:transposase